jgi:formylmethanofuran dehydrogenase subunit E
MQEEIGCLRDAIEVITKCKARKRQYIRLEKTLIVGKVLDLIAKQTGSCRKEGETAAKRVCTGRRCGTCGETRHNSRTYKVEIEDTDNSNASKE